MKRFILAVAILLACTATGVQAQTSVTSSVDGTLATSLYIALSNDGQNVQFGTVSASDFTTGYKQVNGGTLTHKANVAHTVSVYANDAYLTASAGGRTNKPVSDVKWSINGTTYTGFTHSAANAAPIATGVGAGEYTKQLYYRMMLDWAADIPASYSVSLTFVIAAA